MEKFNKTPLFINNVWTIAIKVSEVVAGLQLLQFPAVQTMLGALPLAQCVGAILVADAVFFAYLLQAGQNENQ